MHLKGNSKAVIAAAEGRHDGFGGGHWNGGQESAAGWKGWNGEGGWGEQNYSFGKKLCIIVMNV